MRCHLTPIWMAIIKPLGPPHVVVNIVNYHTQNSANHILLYLIGTLWSGALHKAWLNVGFNSAQMLPSHVSFIITQCFQPMCGPQNL